MNRSTNPVMGSLAKQGQHPFAESNQQQGGQQGQNPYGTMGNLATAQGGAQSAAYHQGMQNAANYGNAGTSDRPMTVDDVVAKTGITLGIIVVMAVVNYFLSVTSPNIGMILTVVGAIGGFVTVLVSTFGKKYGSAAVTIIYALFEGLFVGGISFMFANVTVSGADAGALIGQAVLGTIGVFVGMLFVYKTGAVRVTPKFTRFMSAAIVGVLFAALGSIVLSLFTGTNPLYDGGPIAIGFCLLCIGLAAFSFLMDFDNADRLVRAGAPSKMAWGVALGLTVTLVWLYVEILRLMSYFRD